MAPARRSAEVIDELLRAMNETVTSYHPEVERTSANIEGLIQGTACFPGGAGLWRGSANRGPLPRILSGASRHVRRSQLRQPTWLCPLACTRRGSARRLLDTPATDPRGRGIQPRSVLFHKRADGSEARRRGGADAFGSRLSRTVQALPRRAGGDRQTARSLRSGSVPSSTYRASIAVFWSSAIRAIGVSGHLPLAILSWLTGGTSSGVSLACRGPSLPLSSRHRPGRPCARSAAQPGSRRRGQSARLLLFGDTRPLGVPDRMATLRPDL
jgi:hypothetical protein